MPESVKDNLVEKALASPRMADVLARSGVAKPMAVQAIVGPLLGVDSFDIEAAFAGQFVSVCRSRTKGSPDRLLRLSYAPAMPGSPARFGVDYCPCEAGEKSCRHALQLDQIANLPAATRHLLSGGSITGAGSYGACPWCGQAPERWGKLAYCYFRVNQAAGSVAWLQCAQCGVGVTV